MNETLGSGPLIGLPASVARWSGDTLAGGGEVSYGLPIAGLTGSMSDLIGEHLEIAFLDRISCQACGRVSGRSYGSGYCYPCFKTLARCDLCVMSPDRCHFAQGTCREPEWGQSFCMQPHIVYLANSAGLKVGITRATNLPGRWLDQGAIQALPILRAATREQSGWAERALARYVADRTDWRALVTRTAAPLDLQSEAEALRRRAATRLTELDQRFAGLTWIEGASESRFNYPVSAYAPARQLTLTEQNVIQGQLQGIKGQYLLFDSGVFNVARHSSYHVRLVRLSEPARSSSRRGQMSLFD